MSLSLTDELYWGLHRIKDDYGFKSLNEFITSALNLIVGRILEADDDGLRQLSVEDEVAAIFAELQYWEAQPDGTVPKRSYTPQIDEYETNR